MYLNRIAAIRWRVGSNLNALSKLEYLKHLEDWRKNTGEVDHAV